MTKTILSRAMLVFASGLILVACSADKPEQPAVETAEPTQGQVISEQLHKPLDNAKNVENILQQEAKNLDQQLEEKTPPAADAVKP